nr:hypothetical protein I308_05887 [Cryptococcus tetragattii IND107]
MTISWPQSLLYITILFLSSFSSSGYHATFTYLQARSVSASYLWIVRDFFVANVVDAFIEKAR